MHKLNPKILKEIWGRQYEIKLSIISKIQKKINHHFNENYKSKA